MGYLDHNNKTYVNSTCQENQITTLTEPFNGKNTWHSYSDSQIKETEKWLKYVGERDQIDIRIGFKTIYSKIWTNKRFWISERCLFRES